MARETSFGSFASKAVCLLPGFKTVQSRWLILILAFYFAFVLNLGFWRFIVERIAITDGILFAISLPCLAMILFVWFFSLLVIPVLGKPIIVVLLLLSSAVNCAIWNLGIVMDSTMIRNVFETDVREASDFITVTNFYWVAMTGILPAILLTLCKIEYQSRKKELLTRALFVLVGMVMIGGFYMTTSKEYASFFRNHNKARKMLNTFNYINATVRYFQLVSLAKQEFVWLDREATSDAPDTAKNLMILVVGEAARGMNFSLNGYSRETNPLLSRQNIINFRNATSCGTATAISVPCMFSHKTRKGFDVDEAKYTQNLLDILSVSGYDIFWFDNNSGCKGVCARVLTENMVKFGDATHCEKNYCRDEAMLPGLEEKIKTQEKNMVIVLHMMGSHGPAYYQRYPKTFRKFLPTCDTSDIQKCSREEIVNTYDNTILYTDYILASIVDIAKKFSDRKISVLYASDHGQSLGENGAYLHGLPYAIAPREQTHIPVFLWLSESAQNRIDYACMKEKAVNEPFLHDHIFHSVIGLMQIRTRPYNPSLDIFQGCYRFFP